MALLRSLAVILCCGLLLAAWSGCKKESAGSGDRITRPAVEAPATPGAKAPDPSLLIQDPPERLKKAAEQGVDPSTLPPDSPAPK